MIDIEKMIASGAFARPTIHLNGTSAESLRDAYHAANNALRLAADALDECYPNARDYYPQGEGAYDRALRQHRDRATALAVVRECIAGLEQHCQDALDRQAERRR